MSVQYGAWNFNEPLSASTVARLAHRSEGEHATTSFGSYQTSCFNMGFRALNATAESFEQGRPLQSEHGAVLAWDGRLDNREELDDWLAPAVGNECGDGEVVMGAYLRWGIDCLAKLLGDWALALWEPRENTLFLATDFVGTRHLFYDLTTRGVLWSTSLSDLLRMIESPLSLDREYIAGYFILSTAAHLTPYEQIRQVPPATVVAISPAGVRTQRYFDFDPGKRLSYKDESQYDEHFRQVFATSVKRRLRSNTPVMAELSGGMDSSSIVCVADDLIATGAASVPRLETMSYYDDSEPNWDERPYFAAVEERRGRKGVHIDVSGGFTFEPASDPEYFQPAPPERDQSAIAWEHRRRRIMRERNTRVLLSGIGGDEFLGGVPTPVPELADLLYQHAWLAFLRRLQIWSLSRREPLHHLLWTTLTDFLPAGIGELRREKRIPEWLREDFVRRHEETFLASVCRSRSGGGLPSFQANCAALAAISRQLAASGEESTTDFEIRYPYLDRDLLEFLFAIPREQLVQPGRRRWLMRRALRGIVPETILERRRKAFVARAPVRALSKAAEHINRLTKEMLLEELGLIEGAAFLQALERARLGHEEPVVLILHALRLELWLRRVLGTGLIGGEDRLLWRPETPHATQEGALCPS